VSRLGLLTLIALLLCAVSASANTYSTVLRVYETKGLVPPCQFTSQQLEQALKQTDTYGAQYFADFTQAVQSALQSRAGGACSPTRAALGSSSRGSRPTGKLPGLTAATASGVPAPILLLAGLTALGMLIGGMVTLARWRAWSPAWAGAWRHMWGEAGYRTQRTWQEFTDWFRSG
jgi:hypothetical protein